MRPSTARSVSIESSPMASPRVLPTRLDLLGILPSGGVVAELGVFVGAFAVDILRICRPLELHLVDLWDGPMESGDANGRNILKINEMRFVYEGLERKYRDHPVVRLHRCSTLEALDRFPNGHFDWIYVDASHEHPDVLADLKASSFKSKGMIVGHDYCPAFPGTIRAVDEFCAEFGWTMTAITQDGCPSYLIERS